MEDENLPRDRWLDVEITSPRSSLITRFLPHVYYGEEMPFAGETDKKLIASILQTLGAQDEG